jgi:phosphate transport system permease protein
MATTIAPTFEAYEPRRTGRGWHRDDLSLLLGSAISAGALTWLAIVQLTTIRNIVGLWAIWYVAFLLVYRLVTNLHQGPLAARDKMMTVLIATGALIVLTPLVFIISYVVAKGLPAINGDFFTQDLSMTGTLDVGGGAAHAIVGTLQQIAIACVISVPLGVATAVFLNEVRGPLRRPVRLFVDAMSGVPSIVAGLFIFAVWIIEFGKSFSGFAAALAMSVLMLPSITRTSEEVLRLVPGGLREASLALGSTEWRTTWSVVLPTARAGLVTSVVLGVARAVGETAPLIMTSFGNSAMNANPFNGPQSSLPLYVYTLIRNPFEAQQSRAWGGALVLIVLVLVLFTVARVIGARQPGARR